MCAEPPWPTDEHEHLPSQRLSGLEITYCGLRSLAKPMCVQTSADFKPKKKYAKEKLAAFSGLV